MMKEEMIAKPPQPKRSYEMDTPLEVVPAEPSELTQRALASLHVGLKIAARYLLLNRIAIGGMGEVWRAYDEQEKREVALKILRPELAGQKLFLSRLRIESRNARQVHHPNLAEVLDSGEENGLGWIVMEMVRGKSLTQILDEQITLKVSFLLSILQQTSMALAAVHRSGIVHRDIKPGNIMVTDEGRVKLTDFGISKAVNQITLTAQGMVMGTAQYLPPEQAIGKLATPAGDLYALGIIAYEALAGKRPFTGEKPVDIAFEHVNSPVPALPDNVPMPLQELVMALLEKDPAKRINSAEVLNLRIDQVRDRLLDSQITVNEQEAPRAVSNVDPETMTSIVLNEQAIAAREDENSQREQTRNETVQAALETVAESQNELASQEQSIPGGLETEVPGEASSSETADSGADGSTGAVVSGASDGEAESAKTTTDQASVTPHDRLAGQEEAEPDLSADLSLAQSKYFEEDGSPLRYLAGGTVPAPVDMPAVVVPDADKLADRRQEQQERRKNRYKVLAPLSMAHNLKAIQAGLSRNLAKNTPKIEFQMAKETDQPSFKEIIFATEEQAEALTQGTENSFDLKSLQSLKTKFKAGKERLASVVRGADPAAKPDSGRSFPTGNAKPLDNPVNTDSTNKNSDFDDCLRQARQKHSHSSPFEQKWWEEKMLLPRHHDQKLFWPLLWTRSLWGAVLFVLVLSLLWILTALVGDSSSSAQADSNSTQIGVVSVLEVAGSEMVVASLPLVAELNNELDNSSKDVIHSRTDWDPLTVSNLSEYSFNNTSARI